MHLYYYCLLNIWILDLVLRRHLFNRLFYPEPVDLYTGIVETQYCLIEILILPNNSYCWCLIQSVTQPAPMVQADTSDTIYLYSVTPSTVDSKQTESGDTRTHLYKLY